MNFDNIKIPNAVLNLIKMVGSSAQKAIWDGCEIFRGECSLCSFQGTSFKNANLKQSVMLFTCISNQTNFENTNVDGLLLLGAYNIDGEPITQSWLAAQKAINCNMAITSLADLELVLKNKSIDCDTAEIYFDNISEMFTTLNSLRIRQFNKMEILPEWKNLLSLATRKNMMMLQMAAYQLINYIKVLVEERNGITSLETCRGLIEFTDINEITLNYALVKDSNGQDQTDQIVYDKRNLEIATLLLECKSKLQINIIFKGIGSDMIMYFINAVTSALKENKKINLHLKLDKKLDESDLFVLLDLLKSYSSNNLTIEFCQKLSAECYSRIIDYNFAYPVQCEFEADPYTNALNDEDKIIIKQVQDKIAFVSVFLIQERYHSKGFFFGVPHALLPLMIDYLLPAQIQPPKQKKNLTQFMRNLSTEGLFKFELKSLLEKKYKLKDMTQASLEKALRNAANNGYANDLALIIKYVKNINAVDNNPDGQRTALHYAAQKEHTKCIELLLSAQALANIEDARGITAQSYLDKRSLSSKCG